MKRHSHRPFSPAQLEEVLVSAPDPELLVDHEGRIVFMSQQVELEFGHHPEDLLGQPVEVLIPERFRAGHHDHVCAFMNSPDPRPIGRGLEIWALARDGREVPVEISVSALRQSEERLVLVTLRSVPEHSATLQRVKQLNRDLERQRAELETSVQDLRLLAQMASHDLQTPLRQVRQFLQLLTRRHAEQLGSEAREYIQCAVENTERLSRMVQDVLAYTRVSTSEQVMHSVPLDAVFREAHERLDLLLQQAGAQIESEPLPRVNGDRTQLTQVMQNLLSNALTYRGEAPLRVHVSARMQDGRWCVRVTDNGIGVPEEQRERIFEMFHRVAGSDPGTGSGVGLTICRRVIERHGGRLWVEPAPGGGSAFCFTLEPEAAPVPNAA